MSSTSKIDLGISVPGGDPKKGTGYIHITRKDVIQRVRKHPAIDPWTKDYLCKKIDHYPDSALVYFVQNINEIVVTAINERTRVLREQENERQKAAAAARASKASESFEQQPSSSGCGAGVNEIREEEIRGAFEVTEDTPAAPPPSEEDRESLFSAGSSS